MGSREDAAIKEIREVVRAPLILAPFCLIECPRNQPVQPSLCLEQSTQLNSTSHHLFSL
jgi:hypothetical protein